MASRTLFQKIKNIFSRFKSLFYNDRRIILFRSVRFIRFDSFRLYDCLRRYNTYYCFLRRFLSLPRRVSDRFRTGNRIIVRLRFRRIFRGHTADMGRFQPAAFIRGGVAFWGLRIRQLLTGIHGRNSSLAKASLLSPALAL